MMALEILVVQCRRIGFPKPSLRTRVNDRHCIAIVHALSGRVAGFSIRRRSSVKPECGFSCNRTFRTALAGTATRCSCGETDLADGPLFVGLLVRGDPVVVEHAVRQSTRKPHKRFDEPARGRRPEIGECGGLHEFGQPHRPAREFTESRTQQEFRLERVVARPVEYEHRMHFAGRNPVGETGRHERARTHADIDVEVRKREAFRATSAPIS